MIITRENLKEEASKNTGEPFKKMLVKEVVENEH